ncbi:hypothetical protein ICU_05131 [Bacillus cereus BAG2X1-1]|nr:hypothetical protein ICU_05131 [Bacillus cereus BAG2X1-1]
MYDYGNGITDVKEFINTIENPIDYDFVVNMNSKPGDPIMFVYLKGKWVEAPGLV